MRQLVIRRWFIAVACVVGAIASLGVAGTALAHTELTSSTPANQAILASTPPEILLTFSEGVDPVGQLVRIKNAPFTIVGWLEAKGSGSFGQDQDDILLVPYTAVMKRLSGDTMFRSVFVQAESPHAIADVQNQITSLLRQRHQIAEGRDDDFMVRNQQETSDFFNANNFFSVCGNTDTVCI